MTAQIYLSSSESLSEPDLELLSVLSVSESVLLTAFDGGGEVLIFNGMIQRHG
jgi:hypothetical protein